MAKSLIIDEKRGFCTGIIIA
eukprot:SAG11_NODE_37194_length_258_cov_0.641509_2_plen_20_part_01